MKKCRQEGEGFRYLGMQITSVGLIRTVADIGERITDRFSEDTIMNVFSRLLSYLNKYTQ